MRISLLPLGSVGYEFDDGKIVNIDPANPRLGKWLGKNSYGWKAIQNRKIITDWNLVEENSIVYYISVREFEHFMNIHKSLDL